MWEWGGGEDTLCTWGVVKVWGWGYVVYVGSGEGVGGVGGGGPGYVVFVLDYANVC